MLKLMTGAALATVLVLGAATDADAFSRQRTTTGTYGNSATLNSTTNCAGGVCTRGTVRTGPAGNSVTHGGSATCSGGSCSTSGATTGPRGRNVNRSGTISR